MKVVSTEKAPKALGPYSQGYVHNGIFYSAGQIPINPAVDAVEAETIEEQTEQVCKDTLEIMMQVRGYHFAPTHQIQDNTPVENVVAMYNAAHKYGCY